MKRVVWEDDLCLSPGGSKVSQGSVATCELLVKTSAEQTDQSTHDFGCVVGLFVNSYLGRMHLSVIISCSKDLQTL